MYIRLEGLGEQKKRAHGHLDHEEVRLDSLALVDDPLHQVFDVAADPQPRPGQRPDGEGKVNGTQRFCNGDDEI